MDNNIGFWELVVIIMLGILITSIIITINIPIPTTYSGVEKTINIVAYTEIECVDSYFNTYETPLVINMGIHSYGGIGMHTVKVDYLVGGKKVISDIKINGKWMSDIQKSEYEKSILNTASNNTSKIPEISWVDV